MRYEGALLAAGIPPWQADGLIEDYAHYRRGEAAAVADGVRQARPGSRRARSEHSRATTYRRSRRPLPEQSDSSRDQIKPADMRRAAGARRLCHAIVTTPQQTSE